MSKRQSAILVRAVIFAFLCAPVFSFGCIWIDGTTLDGFPDRKMPIMEVWRLSHVMNQSPQQRLKVLRHNYSYDRQQSSSEELKAIEAMLSGDPKTAVLLLLQIERTSPGGYSTAANLGTAYELSGDNQNALKWITEGIARNSESHAGTEWLHQRILETKLRLASDPDYLHSQRIIPLPENFGFETRVNVGGVDRTIRDIAVAISYQLNERIVFVKPPDAIVADLLFTLAQIQARTEVVESGLKFLEISKQYGFSDPLLLQQTAASYEAAIFRGKIYKYIGGAVLVIAICGALGLFLERKRVASYVRGLMKHKKAANRDRK